jgi:2-polyprenyl-3-methyl-5-hydroxy-6-metoxy-1,4-benzoquinol methylase
MDLAAYVNELNLGSRTYHRIDFGSGVVLDGHVDPSLFLEVYELPGDLTGVTVLDVGTATGFFALECARRGGDVTAIDVFDGLPLTRLAELSGLSIRFVQKSIYDLNEAFGTFDLVICGSLFMHLPDFVGATRALRTVCSGRLILSTACTSDSESNPYPLFDLAGTRAREADYWTYWIASAAGMAKLAEVCDFSIERTAHFTLISNDSIGETHIVPHVLISARPV